MTGKEQENLALFALPGRFGRQSWRRINALRPKAIPGPSEARSLIEDRDRGRLAP
jgi:hypothetical protein